MSKLCLTNVLHSIDLFGHDLTFKHKKSYKFTTALGGVSTIISGAFLLYVLIYFSRDLLNKTNPTVRQTAYFQDNNYLNTSTYFYGLDIVTDANVPMENPEKFLIFHAVITSWNAKKQEKTYTFSKCDLRKHFNKVDIQHDYIHSKLLHFNTSFCLDLEDGFQLLNGFADIPRQSIRVFVVECMNKTIDGIDYTGRCAPKEEIDRKLESFMVNSFMYDSFIDTDDSEKSNKADIKRDSISINLNKGNCEKLFIGYTYSSTHTDKGFLFEDLATDLKLKIHEYIPDGTMPTLTLGLNMNILYWVEIYAKQTNTTTYIKFSKMQDVLANLGGVINFFKLFFLLIFKLINHYNLPFVIFSEAQIHNEVIWIDKKKPVKENVSAFGKLTELKLNANNKETKANGMNKDSTKLEMGFSRYLCAKCKQTQPHYKFMRIILDKVDKELEIKNYLRTREDLYLMKTILFTTEEYAMFNTRHNFGEICKAMEDGSDEYEGFHGYLKRSYTKETSAKPQKIRKYDSVIRNLKSKYSCVIRDPIKIREKLNNKPQLNIIEEDAN